MSQLVGFVKLPRELRDQIYEDYFTIEGGYSYNHRTNRLTTAKGQVIDLNIRLASRKIAGETRGLALRLNAIRFWTVFDEELRERAGHFNTLLEMIGNLKAAYLLWHSPRSGFVDDEVHDYAKENFPEFLSIVQTMQTSYINSSDSNTWKETPSRSRHFIASTLENIAG